MKAKTDMVFEISFELERKEVNNLVNIYSQLTDKELE
jgi:hypothetical protein